MKNMCIEICDAMNEIEGIETVESCSGHSKLTFRVSFTTWDGRCIYAILRANDRRYGGPGWKCEISSTDIPRVCVIYSLESRTTGKSAYAESRLIAKNIREILDDSAICDTFLVRRKR